MVKLTSGLVVAVLAVSLAAVAQVSTPPADQKPKESPSVTRLMSYGKKEPGKVWRDEVTDERLFKLFDLADTKKAGVVTKDQLISAAAKLDAEQPQGGRRGEAGGPGDRGGFGGGQGGPGGFGGGNRGGGPGGFGGPGFGRPQPGTVMPKFIQDELQLSDAQRQQVAELQKDVDAKIEAILTADQKKQLQDMKDNAGRGPGGGGRGPGGGRGGPPQAPPQ